MRIFLLLASSLAIAALTGCSTIAGWVDGDEPAAQEPPAQVEAPKTDNSTAASPVDTAARAAFVGQWVEPVPGLPGRTQGYEFREDGKASSIGMATLAVKRWEIKGDVLTIWGDSIGNGMTIPFEMQYLVLEIGPDKLHLRQGSYEHKFTRKQ